MQLSYLELCHIKQALRDAKRAYEDVNMTDAAKELADLIKRVEEAKKTAH